MYTLQEMNQLEKMDLKKRSKFMKSVIANIDIRHKIIINHNFILYINIHRKKEQKHNF